MKMAGKVLLTAFGAAALVALFQWRVAELFTSLVPAELAVDENAWAALIAFNAALTGLAMAAGKFVEAPNPETAEWGDLIAPTATETVTLSFGVLAQFGMLWSEHRHRREIYVDDSPLAALIYLFCGDGSDAASLYRIIVEIVLAVSVACMVAIVWRTLCKGAVDRRMLWFASPLALFLFTADTLLLHPWLGANDVAPGSAATCADIWPILQLVFAVCVGVAASLFFAGLCVRWFFGGVVIFVRSPEQRRQILRWGAVVLAGAMILAIGFFICWFCMRPAPPVQPPPPCECCCCACPELCPREPACEEPSSCAPCESDARCASCAPPTQ